MDTGVRLIYQSWGNGITIGVKGPKKNVEFQCNQLYNYNATDSAPIWVNDNEQNSFAYVLTDWNRLKKSIANMFIANHNNSLMLARAKASELCDLIPLEKFLTETPASILYLTGHNKQDKKAVED